MYKFTDSLDDGFVKEYIKRITNTCLDIAKDYMNNDNGNTDNDYDNDIEEKKKKRRRFIMNTPAPMPSYMKKPF